MSEPTIYQHTQTGTFIVAALGIVVLVTIAAVVVAIARGGTLPPLAIAIVAANFVILSIVVAVFSILTVRVDAQAVACQFRFGLLRRQFEIAAIDGAESVRNPWYYGWGIRLTPQGWMYNVSGFDVVQLRLASGKRFRIGTDEPEQLKAAIETAIAQQTREM
ncbi:MAG: hypothetical protein ACFB9N_00955 [Geitlerinemataceae cyanobacterium]